MRACRSRASMPHGARTPDEHVSQANRPTRSPGRTITGRGVVGLLHTRLGPAMDSALTLTLTLTQTLILTPTFTLTLALTPIKARSRDAEGEMRLKHDEKVTQLD